MGLTRKDIVEMAVLLFGCFLVVLNATLLTPALPVIMRDTGVGATTVQWLTSAYALVEAVVIPLNAFLLGRFSQRKLFIGSFLLFVSGSLVAAFSPTFGWLLFGRVLQACATGVAMPMVWTLVLVMTPRENRGSIMGIVGLVIAFAPAVGPPLSGVLTDAVGWRALFLIVSAVGVAVVIVAAFLLKNRQTFERTSFDAFSVVLSSFGMAFLLYGLSTCTSTDKPWLSILLMVAGVALLDVFVRWQRKLPVPMLRIGTLRVRRFRIAVIVCCLLEGALIAIDVLLPMYIQNSLGKTATVSGLAMMPAAFSGAIAGIVAGRIFDKHGVRKIVLVGAVMLETSAIALCLCGLDTSVVVVALIYALEGIGWQFVSTPTNTWGINSLRNDVIQHGNALLSTCMQVGASFGTAAIVSLTALGPLFAPEGDALAVTLAGQHAAFAGTAILLAVVAIIIVVGVRDKEEDPSIN